MDYAPDGDLQKYNDAIIAGSVGITHQHASCFVECMVETTFIDRKPYFRVHDWWDYFGRFLKIKHKDNPLKWQEIKDSYEVNVHGPRKGIRSTHRKPVDRPTDRPTFNQPTDRPLAPGLKPVAKGAEVWAAYAESYKIRYGVDPVRNQSVNAMLCKLVDKLGADEAPQVAAFYVTHQSSWYKEKMHPVNLLLQDAEKLRTEWATGRQAMGRFDQPKVQPRSMVDLL